MRRRADRARRWHPRGEGEKAASTECLRAGDVQREGQSRTSGVGWACPKGLIAVMCFARVAEFPILTTSNGSTSVATEISGPAKCPVKSTLYAILCIVMNIWSPILIQ